MIDVTSLQSLIAEPLWIAFAVFLRIVAAVNVLPVFGEQILSVRIKLVLALMLTLVILLTVAPTLSVPPAGLNGFLRLIATETLSGLFLGLMLRMFIFAIQTAGGR